MEKISSKFIGEKDIVIPKPTYLKTLINIKDPEKIYYQILANFLLEIKHYFQLKFLFQKF